MSKMIQVRNVPDHVHRTLKSRAARESMSLSDFLKKELARAAERPTMQEWLERAQEAAPIRAKRSPAQVIRELRDSR
jgi:antitoxin FitA